MQRSFNLRSCEFIKHLSLWLSIEHARSLTAKRRETDDKAAIGWSDFQAKLSGFKAGGIRIEL